MVQKKHQPNNLIIFIDDHTKINFFRKFENVLNRKNINYFLYTDKFSISKIHDDINFVMDKKFQLKVFDKLDLTRIINESIEFISNEFSYDECKRYCYYCSQFIHRMITNTDQIFLFNGSRLIHKLIFQISRMYKINILFFENSNIEGRIICDRLGVNSKSSIREKEMLKKFKEPDNINFKQFLNNYKREKLSMHFVKQSIFSKKLNYYYIYDFIKKLQRYPILISLNIPKKIISFLFLCLSKFILRFVNKKNNFTNYLFYPFQVSDDSQLIINANIHNIDALKKIKNNKHKIVVKFHPAERNGFYQLRLLIFCFLNNIRVSSENTWRLINDCSSVVTINSTVGLEAIICRKKLLCLGDPIYKSYDLGDLKKYIFAYLIEVDMFSETPISDFQYDNIMKRNYV